MTQRLEEQGLGKHRINYKLRDVPHGAFLSCWHHLSALGSRKEHAVVDELKQRYWLPVDLYVGSAKHAAEHLLYARLWHMALRDLGVVSAGEPFVKVVHPGDILVEEDASAPAAGGSPHAPDLDDVVGRYGADATRLYAMFLGPLDQAKPWTTSGIEGPHRFLHRVYRLVMEEERGALRTAVQPAEPSREQLRLLHKTIKRVTEDIETLRLNTAVSALMELVNAAGRWDPLPRSVVELLLLILSPFAPHLAEELWSRLGHVEPLARAPWPEALAEHLQEDTIQIAVQVNGKLRGTIQIPAFADKDAILEMARSEPSVAGHLQGKTIRREVYVPGRIVNFVVG
jgi:leucyl-tRNA synthetase